MCLRPNLKGPTSYMQALMIFFPLKLFFEDFYPPRKFLKINRYTRSWSPKSHLALVRNYVVNVDVSRSWGSTWLPNGWMRDLNLQRFLIQSLYQQKASGQGVRTHPPMMLLAMVKRGRYKSVGLLLGILRLPSSSCEGLYI